MQMDALCLCGVCTLIRMINALQIGVVQLIVVQKRCFAQEAGMTMVVKGPVHVSQCQTQTQTTRAHLLLAQ